MAAIIAPLGTGIPLVNLDEGTPVPSCFVLQLAHQLTPTRVRDSPREPTIADQMLDSQCLHTHRLVLTDEACRKLMQSVKPLVSDLGVRTRYLLARTFPVPRLLLFARQCLLRRLQSVATVGEMLGVGDLLARREGHQRRDAQIQPDHLIHCRQWRYLLFHQEGGEVAARWVPAHGDSRWSASEGARPDNGERRVHLSKSQAALLSVPAEGRGGVFRRLSPAFLLEGGIAGVSFEEVTEGAIKMAQRLLGREGR